MVRTALTSGSPGYGSPDPTPHMTHRRLSRSKTRRRVPCGAFRHCFWSLLSVAVCTQYCFFYCLHGLLGVLMLPDPHDCPACVLQRDRVSVITVDVALQLWRPVATVDAGLTAMLWAAVPEAPVDKYRDARPGEHHVRAYSPPREIEAVVLAETKPGSMQRRTEGNLGLRVGAADGLHVPAASSGASRWRRV